MTASVVDLFSGAGGASVGFARHAGFEVVGAADAQFGKPSSPPGGLYCNATYARNIGVQPVARDLGSVSPDELGNLMNLARPPTVLIACPPCTGFSRAVAHNHLRDDPRNGLVRRVALFARAWDPQVIVVENARELVMGRYRGHLDALTADLREQGYRVSGSIHLLNRFGLPQRRERAVIIAVKSTYPLFTLDDLWKNHEVDPKATHVRRAIWDFPPLENGARHVADAAHVCSKISKSDALARTRAIPHDGGSWIDLTRRSETLRLLTPAMQSRVAENRLGSHPDVYGRMYWDRPAPTIKRECSHVGNGRYTHPDQDRLCSVRELASLNGFPTDYLFAGGVNNMYRHVGDAVPPMISHQLAHLTHWILGGRRPSLEEIVLPRTSLRPSDIRRRA